MPPTTTPTADPIADAPAQPAKPRKPVDPVDTARACVLDHEQRLAKVEVDIADAERALADADAAEASAVADAYAQGKTYQPDVAKVERARLHLRGLETARERLKAGLHQAKAEHRGAALAPIQREFNAEAAKRRRELVAAAAAMLAAARTFARWGYMNEVVQGLPWVMNRQVPAVALDETVARLNDLRSQALSHSLRLPQMHDGEPLPHPAGLSIEVTPAAIAAIDQAMAAVGKTHVVVP